MIVIDASVAAKWFLPEKGVEQALALQQADVPLVAPDLIVIEVCAAITRRFRKGELPLKETERCVAQWLGYARDDLIELTAADELLEEAAQFSLRLKHPLQDCLYLAAAAQRQAPLITADEAFYKRAAGCGVEVRLLGEMR